MDEVKRGIKSMQMNQRRDGGHVKQGLELLERERETGYMRVEEGGLIFSLTHPWEVYEKEGERVQEQLHCQA